MDARTALVVAASVATAVNAGVFFAFSTFVMRAVGDLAPAESVRAMQAVNRRAPTPGFMALLFGSTVLAVASGVLALLGGAAGRWSAVGGAVVAVAALAVTVVVNIPLNDRLERTDPGSDAAGAQWQAYAGRWTRANHLRCALGVLASLLLAASAVTGG